MPGDREIRDVHEERGASHVKGVVDPADPASQMVKLPNRRSEQRSTMRA